MNNYDLSSVLANAAKVAQDSSESNNENSIKIVYPQDGVMKLRLIFNNASGAVMRKFERHVINDSKVPCLTMYGQECPICKALDNISSAKGLDLWKLKRTTRGIAYAEYIESDYKWADPKYEPKRGEIVLFMFPWTIYTDLNRLISSAGQNVYSLICSNVGGIFKISRWSEKGQIKYRAEIDPFETNHQTRPTDDEYEALIRDNPSLNDRICPSTLTEDIVKQARDLADQLNREYLSSSVVQPNVGQSAQTLAQVAAPQIPNQNPSVYVDPTTETVYDNINGQWVPRISKPVNPIPQPPVAPQQPIPSQPAINQGQPSNLPPCYGRHGAEDANKCLMCPREMQCRGASGTMPF